jgi:hypothetical protein
VIEAGQRTSAPPGKNRPQTQLPDSPATFCLRNFDHAQRFRVRQHLDEFLFQSLREVRILGIGTQIGKWKYREVDPAGRRSAPPEVE